MINVYNYGTLQMEKVKRMRELEHYPKTPGAYILTHEPTGRFYIGSSGDLRSRLLDHRRLLIRGVHGNKNLLDCFTEWGDIDIKYELFDFRSEAYRREDELLGYFHGQPLCCNVGRDPHGAFIGGMPEETKHKLRLANLGRRHSDEFKQKCSIRLTGHRLSEETRRRISEANLGKSFSDEIRLNMREAKTLTAGKSIIIKGIRYRSYAEAVRALGIHESTIRQRVANKSSLFDDWKLDFE